VIFSASADAQEIAFADWERTILPICRQPWLLGMAGANQGAARRRLRRRCRLAAEREAWPVVPRRGPARAAARRRHCNSLPQSTTSHKAAGRLVLRVWRVAVAREGCSTSPRLNSPSRPALGRPIRATFCCAELPALAPTARLVPSGVASTIVRDRSVHSFCWRASRLRGRYRSSLPPKSWTPLLQCPASPGVSAEQRSSLKPPPLAEALSWEEQRSEQPGGRARGDGDPRSSAE